jgi:hypothetical protein
VDPESWAEYGGWYRQDHAIYYRPVGHKDKFIYAWLYLTGPRSPRGDGSPLASVFDYLTDNEAQGSCTKCHSVDDIQGSGRLVNFSPLSVAAKQGRFTTFTHEPHFGIVEQRTGKQEGRGCLACHSLAEGPSKASQSVATDAAAAAETVSAASAAAPSGAPSSSGVAADPTEQEKAGTPYLKSYAQGNPHQFVSGFGSVKEDLCRTCHTATKARQDCLLCHKYHVNGVTTPIMSTKNPVQ